MGHDGVSAGWADDYLDNERFGESHSVANANKYNPTKEEIFQFQKDEAERLEKRKQDNLYEAMKERFKKDQSLSNLEVNKELNKIYKEHELKMQSLEIKNEKYIDFFIDIQNLILSNNRYSLPSALELNNKFSKIKKELIKNNIDSAVTRTFFKDKDGDLGLLKISSSPYLYTDIYQINNNEIINKERYPDKLYFNKGDTSNIREDYYGLINNFNSTYNYFVVKNDNLYVTKEKYSFENFLKFMKNLDRDKLIKILVLD